MTDHTKKSILVVTCVALGSILLAVLIGLIVLACVFFSAPKHSGRGPEEIQAAAEELGLENVTVIIYSGWAPPDASDPAHIAKHSVYLALGEKDGAEAMAVVPADTLYDDSYISAWPYRESFEQIVARMNEVAVSKKITEETLASTLSLTEDGFYPSIFRLSSEKTYRDKTLDVPCRLTFADSGYDEFSVYQVDGEIIVEVIPRNADQEAASLPA